MSESRRRGRRVGYTVVLTLWFVFCAAILYFSDFGDEATTNRAKRGEALEQMRIDPSEFDMRLEPMVRAAACVPDVDPRPDGAWPDHDLVDDDALTTSEIITDGVTVSLECKYRLASAYARGHAVVFTTIIPNSIPGRQAVVGASFNPRPSGIYDGPGGRFAVYRFSHGVRDLRIEQIFELEVTRPRTEDNRALSRSEIGEFPEPYLAPETGIESTYPAIVAAAERISSGNPFVMARACFETARDLENRRARQSRQIALGAAAAADFGVGHPNDRTDYFIALCRAKGVPARHVQGVTVRKRRNVHEWAQVWLPRRGWVDADLSRSQTGTFPEPVTTRVVLDLFRKNPDLGGFHGCYLCAEGGDGLDWNGLSWNYALDVAEPPK